IENFGSMNILCSDKTGTITVGEVKLDSAVDVDGKPSDKVLLFAQLNAHFQAGYTNPIDAAILDYRELDAGGYRKLDEEAYDFVRKRLSVLVSNGKESVILTKGALSNILAVCTNVETAEGGSSEVSQHQAQIQEKFEELSGQGFRVVGVAYRSLGDRQEMERTDESSMTFLGFLALFDPI